MAMKARCPAGRRPRAPPLIRRNILVHIQIHHTCRRCRTGRSMVDSAYGRVAAAAGGWAQNQPPRDAQLGCSRETVEHPSIAPHLCQGVKLGLQRSSATIANWHGQELPG